MTVPEVIAALERFRLAHAAEVDAWAERRHAEIHAMSVARTRGLGQLFRHARIRLLVVESSVVPIADPDAVAVYQLRRARDLALARFAASLYHL